MDILNSSNKFLNHSIYSNIKSIWNIFDYNCQFLNIEEDKENLNQIKFNGLIDSLINFYNKQDPESDRDGLTILKEYILNKQILNTTSIEERIENDTVENGVVENDVVETNAVENDAVENDAVENDAVDKKSSKGKSKGKSKGSVKLNVKEDTSKLENKKTNKKSKKSKKSVKIKEFENELEVDNSKPKRKGRPKMGRTIWNNIFKTSPEYNEAHNLIITCIEDEVDVNELNQLEEDDISENLNKYTIPSIISSVLDIFGINEGNADDEINSGNEDSYNFAYVKEFNTLINSEDYKDLLNNLYIKGKKKHMEESKYIHEIINNSNLIKKIIENQNIDKIISYFGSYNLSTVDENLK
jgi:hypothetical protein